MGWRLLTSFATSVTSFATLVTGFATLVAGVALGPATARACSCAPPPPPIEALAQADAVFEGTVTQNERVGNQRTVRFQVVRVWKGEVPADMAVVTADNEAACGVSFPVGVAFLVYGRRDNNQLVASLCSRTSALASAQADLPALGPGAPPTSVSAIPSPRLAGGGCSASGIPTPPTPAALLLLLLIAPLSLRKRDK